MQKKCLKRTKIGDLYDFKLHVELTISYSFVIKRKVAAFPEQNMKLCIQVAKLVPKNAGIVTCQIFLKKCPKMPYFGRILKKNVIVACKMQKILK